MATIRYRINEKSKSNPTKIYIRFRGDNFDCETPTNIQVYKNDWSASKQKLKATSNLDTNRVKINNQLDDLKKIVNDRFNEDYNIGVIIDTHWLKELINVFHNQPTASKDPKNSNLLIDYAKQFIQNLKDKRNKRTGLPLNKRTIQDYENSLEKIIRFDKFKKTNTKLDTVNLTYHSNFIKFLRSIDFLGENTIGGVISNLKTFLKDADIQGLKVHKDYKTQDFYAPSFKPKDIYLDESEIDKIRTYQFEKDGFLDNARDWLIIGLWTGLRVSDLLRLTIKDLKGDYIDNTNFKTNIPVTIPIHPHVREILTKRNWQFPRYITEQNFNDYIKQVAENVGLKEKVNGAKMMLMTDGNGKPLLNHLGKKIHRKQLGTFPKYELVTTHICRRSFASNLYGKIDTLTIMKITGHQTEKQFLSYIKITPKHHAEKLSQWWAEYYK